MLAEAVSFPPIVLQDFSEQRIQRPVRGSMTSEVVDIRLTKPLDVQLNTFLRDEGRMAFNPGTSHANSVMANGDRFISVCYILASAKKSDAARMLYGA